MVQVKAHLGNRWPQLNFIFLPIGSELTVILVHPQLHSAGWGGIDWCVNFELDLQILQQIVTPRHNVLTQKIRDFSFGRNQQQKTNWRQREETQNSGSEGSI